MTDWVWGKCCKGHEYCEIVRVVRDEMKRRVESWTLCCGGVVGDSNAIQNVREGKRLKFSMLTTHKK